MRFSAQLGFEIDKATKDAARELAPTLVKISRERIHTELNKLLLSDNPDYFSVVYELGVMKVIISELEGVNSGDIDRLKVLIKRTKPCLPERYAALLSVIGKDKTRAVLKGLKLDNATISMAVKLVEYLGITPALTEPQMRHYINEVGKEDALRVIDFNLAFASEDEYKGYTDMRNICVTVLERGDCTSLKELRITGKLLMNSGFEAGKQLGGLLEELLLEVLDNPALNDTEYLLERAKELKTQ